LILRLLLTQSSLCPWVYARNGREIKLCNADGGVARKYELGDTTIREFVRLDNGDFLIADSIKRVLSRWSIKDGEIKTLTNLSPFEPLGVALSLKKELLVGMKDRFNTRRIVQKMAINGRILHSYEYEEGHREWIKYYLFKSPDRVAENFNTDLCG
jgi:hypothetical protein